MNFINKHKHNMVDKVITYWGNGDILSIGYYTSDDKLHGEFISQCGGIINMRQNYENGELHGQSIIYHNGSDKIDSVTNYRNGIEEGYYTAYHKNGNLRTKVNYINGIKEGLSIHYYKNGDLDRKGYYINGKLNGVVTSFFPSNIFEGIFIYSKGRCIGTWQLKN